MSQIFISYSNRDKDFALHLVNDLERFYDVWIDKGALEGGLEWEEMIDAALQECNVFVVIVSPYSNKSDWVARETIRAEQLNKYRIPVLINGELPLRLLNVHYVDFKGEYEGGFRDLLEALKKQIEPQDRKHDEANRLVGEGIRFHFSHDYSKANSLIGQAIIIDPQIAQTVEAFWEMIKRDQQTNWASEFITQIQIKEQAKLDEKDVYAASAMRNVDYYRWTVEIAASDDILNKIDYVHYQLHPTYRNPDQVVRARENNFRLRSRGWGTFKMMIDVAFKDGSIGHGAYTLELKDQIVFLSSVSVD
jgi:hypothetical protein